MAAVAELNGVTVKPERRAFTLRLVLEVTFGTVFPGPVGIDYFLLCCTGRSTNCHSPEEGNRAEQYDYYPATAQAPVELG
jgi:hypothetical protein